MIPGTIAKWTTRVLFVLALALFAATFTYAMTRIGATTVGPDGDQVVNVTNAEGRRIAVLFSATGWSICAMLAVRVLARSSSLPRVLIGLARPLGFGLMATAPIAATSGARSDPVSLIAAGIFLVVASVFVEFVVFGAREAVEAVQASIVELAEARGQGPDATTGVDTDAQPPVVPQATLMPQPMEAPYPPPVGEAQPGPEPGGAS
jgi:hypothetical protein